MVSIKQKHTEKSIKEPIVADAWLRSISTGRTEQEMDVIRRACRLAEQAHAGQSRASGEPYFQHSLAVANILAELHLDSETIAAALLHDVIEDSEILLREIQRDFGLKIAHLVDGVTKMQAIQSFQAAPDKSGRKETRQAESLRKMLLAMVEDIRVVFIKLADRAHNMRTLAALPPEKQKAIAQETMDVYAPLANRLGIWQLKWELEDLSFKFLHPDKYRQIAGFLNERRVDRENYIAEVLRMLRDELAGQDIKAEVTGRPKHIYSIWRKMQQKNLGYQQIYDIRAVRILVPEIRDCYTALGIVHSLWQYIPGEFDDYIATPKENNYQSIHTAVIGPQGKTLEVQIRTFDMHNQSELGVAAHWRYKEGMIHDTEFMNKIALMRQLLEWKEDIARSSSTIEQIKLDIFKDRVYVFTPKGKVVDMPQGATPLDFAYHIHTDIGHRCRGVKVNDNMVPLTYTLQSGDQVEILTAKRGAPSRDWLNPHLGFLKTSRAREKVQHWFRQLDYEANVAEGRELLDKELQRLALPGIKYEDLARMFEYENVDDLLAAIGRHDLKISQILHALDEKTEARKAEEKIIPAAPAFKPQKTGGDVEILGVGNLMTHIARCCRPLPGDRIVGYITRGKGVTIHREGCPNALRYKMSSAERLIDVNWGSSSQTTYPVNILIRAFDRQGLLRDITSVLANEEINVTAANTLSNKKNHVADMILTIEISNINELSKVLAKIQQLPNILEVKRQLQ